MDSSGRPSGNSSPTMGQAETPAVTPAKPPCEWIDEDGTAQDDHDWEYIRDWAGDPGVINGTYDINYKRCRQCGKEAEWDGRADDYEEDYR